jgi:ketosteroid isomerase-like protein
MLVSRTLLSAWLLTLGLAPGVARAQFSSPALPPPRTAADSAFRAFLLEFEAGTSAMINGSDSLWDESASHAEDVTFFGPSGGIDRGWGEVGPMYRMGASRLTPSGAKVSVEYLAIGVSGDLAYTVAIERSTFRMAGQANTTEGYTRATDVFRREDGHWKLVHRHMDHMQPKQ